MRILIPICTLLLMMLACQLTTGSSAASKEVAALQKETEDIHDIAMRDLAGMNRHSRQLKELLTVARMLPEAREAVLDTLSRMETAESEMYEWMQNYKAPDADTPPEQAKAYLLEQKALIIANGKKIKELAQ
jgi:hypothetical protein